MNENTFIDSFFFPFYLFLFFSSAFLSCKPFRNNWMHSEVIANPTYFLWKYDWKRRLEKCFLGARVWPPKPVYLSPNWCEYVTGFKIKLVCTQLPSTNLYQLWNNCIGINLFKIGGIVFSFQLYSHSNCWTSLMSEFFSRYRTLTWAFLSLTFPVGIYLLEVKNRNTRGVVLVSLLLTFNM